MRQLGIMAVGMAVMLLSGCQRTTTERQADEVRNTSARQAENVREQTQSQADGIRDQAEAQADRVESQGERMADVIEERGERTADAIEAAEDKYWRDNFAAQPYVRQGASYDEYRAAYRFGWQARQRHLGKTFDEVEDDLEREWNQTRQNTDPSWEVALPAVRDAWGRLD